MGPLPQKREAKAQTCRCLEYIFASEKNALKHNPKFENHFLRALTKVHGSLIICEPALDLPEMNN